ncbi:MAG: 4Fe-4S binding protein [Peptococcaceae bacterium]|jgi:2-oxoglutarate ferredoxin oxidoreductase subunit delta|nr:4Fe-4S binding protein [Peptococcaceae bacterium]
MTKFLLQFRKEYCKGCELCVASCPKGILAIGDEIGAKGYRTVTMTDMEQCIGCQSCALMCPDCAIEIYREEDE